MKKPPRPQPAPASLQHRMLPLALLAVILANVAAAIYFWSRPSQRAVSASPVVPSVAYQPHAKGELNFNQHIAPILFEHCSGCHRPGQSAPFPLLAYGDARKHGRDIVQVTERRYMPPWPPVAGHGDFVGERRLTAQQIGQLAQWVAEGMLEGPASSLPPAPVWKSDWHLGPPDLVVTMPAAYSLAPDGPDVYRNFVVPVPITAPRYVRALDFRPGNPRIVHHTLIKVDRTGESLRLDARDVEPGFPGMVVPSETGHFLGWQPGRRPHPVPEGLAWQIRPGDALILQMHLSPSGKPEQEQSTLALYFTDQAPTATPFRVLLTSIRMDIPAGAAGYAIEDEYTLPVDVDLLAVLPHAHYLGKTVEARATLPDGRIERIIRIDDWDFNWQSDYVFKKPVPLPKGTKLWTRFTFDNSTNNVRNPRHPPVRVRYGPQSYDEMAEFWLQVLPQNRAELPALASHYEAHARRRFFEGNLHLAQLHPPDATAQSTVGLIYLAQRNLLEAEKFLRGSIATDPNHAPGHYGLGVLLRQQGQLAPAQAELAAAARLDPYDARPHGNLGYIALQQGALDAAAEHFAAALKLNPGDALASGGLAEVMRIRQRGGR